MTSFHDAKRQTNRALWRWITLWLVVAAVLAVADVVLR